MSDKLENLNAEQLKTLLSTLVSMGVSEVDADQTLRTLVEDNEVEDQDVELEFVYKSHPITVVVKASVDRNDGPVYAVLSEEADLEKTLEASL